MRTYHMNSTRQSRAREAMITVRHGDNCALHFYAEDGQLFGKHQWIDDFYLAREHERGLSDRDSHLCAAHLRYN